MKSVDVLAIVSEKTTAFIFMVKYQVKRKEVV